MWQPMSTAPKNRYVCVATHYGSAERPRWGFNHAWFDDQTEEWTDEFGDQVLHPHVWCELPPNQSDPRPY